MQLLKKFFISRADLFVLLICLLITFFSWQIGVVSDRTDQTQLVKQRDQLQQEMNTSGENVFRQLDGLAGLFSSMSHEITPDALSTFIRTSNAKEYVPELLRIGFIERVDQAQIPAFEKKMRVEGNVNYQAVPEPKSSVQFYVAETVNQAGKIFVPSGRNLMSDPVSKKSIDELMSGGESFVRYSPTVQNIDEYHGTAFIFSVPVYSKGELIGVLNGVVSKDAMEAKIKKILGNSVEWHWKMVDGVSLASSGNAQGNTVTTTTKISINGQEIWQIDLKKEVAPSRLWNTILGIGVLISIILYTMTYGLSTTNARAEEVAKMTLIDLQKYKLAVESTSSYMVITDVDGKILFINKTAERLTGYTLKEAMGNTPRLWGRQMDREFYEKMWHQIKTERKVFKGEITNKRKDGSFYIALATISPIVEEKSGELLGFVAVGEDITKQKKFDEELMKKTEELERINKLMVDRELAMIKLKDEISRLKSDKKT